MARAYTTDASHGGAELPDDRSGARHRGLLERWRDGRGMWRRGLVLAGSAVLLALVMVFHAQIPNGVGNLGSLTETFLPWLGLGIPVLLVLGFVRRSATALIAVLVPVIVWANMFGGLLTNKKGSGGSLTVATHNVNAENTDPAGTARTVAASGAQIIALEELTPQALPAYERALAEEYPHHQVEGTVGVWSKYPLGDTRPVDIELGWTRALRTTAATPQGEVAVYVAHLPSVRVKLDAGFTASQRDRSADALGEAIAGERLGDVILLGDLNGTMNDRALNEVTSQMRSTQGAAGDGFGFSWPAGFPMARIDQIMVKGVEPVESWTLPKTASDHLPVAATVGF